MEKARTIWRSLLDVLFPRPKRVAELEETGIEGLRSLLSPARKPDIEGVRPLFDYSDERVRALVHEIKFRGNGFLADMAAELIAEEVVEELSRVELFEKGAHPLIVPIPASRERRLERGFNQTELLARKVWEKGLSEILVYAPNAVAKHRHTAPQTSLPSREERLRNLDGAFSVTNPALVRDRHVVVIDDVVTTGATVTEVRRVLLENGARSVIAFSIAH